MVDQYVEGSEVRIAFVISDQHLIPHGGIGQFFKGFYEQICLPQGHIVDLIMDKPASETEFLKSFGFDGNIIAPVRPMSYSGHRDCFAFKESINFEKSINFRDAFLRSTEKFLYDLVIINSIEAAEAIYSLSISKLIPVVLYTHSEYLAGFGDYHGSTFTKEFVTFNKALAGLDGFILATQTPENVVRIQQTLNVQATCLRMPIPETGLLRKYTGKKEGVLFIGRWEDRKNPEAFIDVIKKTGLLAKVMTNSNGAKKFKKAFEAAGITNFAIKEGLTGKSKVDFIQSSKVYYNPSKLESFGFTMLEGLSSCTTVVHSGVDWTDNFKGKFNFSVVDPQDAASEILSLYVSDDWENDSNIKEYCLNMISDWKKFFKTMQKQNKNSTCAFSDNDDFYYSDFIDGLQRSVSIEDFQSAVRNMNQYQVVQTKEYTWLSKSGNPPIIKTNNVVEFE